MGSSKVFLKAYIGFPITNSHFQLWSQHIENGTFKWTLATQKVMPANCCLRPHIKKNIEKGLG
jgi:hypothetical protein